MNGGGGRGIRTPDEVALIVVFKTTALSRSAIPPGEGVSLNANASIPCGKTTVKQALPIDPACDRIGLLPDGKNTRWNAFHRKAIVKGEQYDY